MSNVFRLKKFVWYDNRYNSYLDCYNCGVMGANDEWVASNLLFPDSEIENILFETRDAAKNAVEAHIKRYFSRLLDPIEIEDAARKAFEAAQGVSWDTIGDYSKDIYRKMVSAFLMDKKI